MAWCISDLANEILKNVINHTRNIQGKDIERLPYPFWIDDDIKKFIIERTLNIFAFIEYNDRIESYKKIINKLFTYD